MDLKAWSERIEESYSRIRGHVRWTPLQYSFDLSELSEAKVHLKLESEQETGSFKLRGAFIKLTQLAGDEGAKSHGVTVASTGNHALACLHAMSRLGISGTFFAPTNISPAKEGRLVRRGAVLCKSGQDCIEGELKARDTAQKEGRTYISPYNDPDVIAGQGTISVEILSDLPDVDTVLVPVGGGGLIAGIAAYLKHKKPTVKVVGCQPLHSKVMYESVRAGRILEEQSLDTLSDGTAGGIEPGAITFEMCQRYVDDWLIVTEEQIARGVYFMMDKHHKIVEGAAGVVIGGYMANTDRFQAQNVVLIVCGSNISMKMIEHVIKSRENNQ